jgi:hypothetical protein
MAIEQGSKWGIAEWAQAEWAKTITTTSTTGNVIIVDFSGGFDSNMDRGMNS